MPAYYEAISRGGHHNYYFGRSGADVTPRMEYFILGMLDSFGHVKKAAQGEAARDKSALLRSLSPRHRKLLVFFSDNDTMTSRDAEALFGFSPRSARLLCQRMAGEGFIVATDPSDKARRYKLAEKYMAAFS